MLAPYNNHPSYQRKCYGTVHHDKLNNSCLMQNSRIYKAPLQEIYSEVPPAQPWRYRSVLSNLQNTLSLFLGRRRISKGRPFQVEGPTLENARRCLVEPRHCLMSKQDHMELGHKKVRAQLLKGWRKNAQALRWLCNFFATSTLVNLQPHVPL